MKYWHKRGAIEHMDTEPHFVADDGSYIIPLTDFERVSGSRYHGVAGCTNTSALGIVLGSDGESAVIQFFG